MIRVFQDLIVSIGADPKSAVLHPDHLTLTIHAMNHKIVVPSIEAKLFCICFGHKLITVRKITRHFEEYECRVCRKQFTRDSMGKVVAMTPLLKDINETIFNVYLKRNPGKSKL